MRLTTYLVLLGLLTLSACKKKDKELTKSDFLQQGKWKLTSATFNGFYNLMDQFKDCQKDNTYVFNSNKTITVDEAATKCSDTSAQTRTEGTWDLSSNDSKISIGGIDILAAIGELTGDVQELSTTTFSVKKDTSFSGISGTINISFTNVK